MSAPHRYRAFRFFHPDFDVGASGMRLAATGGFDTVADDDSLRQSILLLLSTVPGERVMRPEFGCNLRRLVFSPNDDTTAGLAAHYVRQAIKRWEPRVELTRVETERDEARPFELRIYLEYIVAASGRSDSLAYQWNLAEGVAR